MLSSQSFGIAAYEKPPKPGPETSWLLRTTDRSCGPHDGSGEDIEAARDPFNHQINADGDWWEDKRGSAIRGRQFMAHCDGEASSQESEGAGATGTSELQFDTPQPRVPTKSSGNSTQECTKYVPFRTSSAFASGIDSRERAIRDESRRAEVDIVPTGGGVGLTCRDSRRDTFDVSTRQAQAPPSRLP